MTAKLKRDVRIPAAVILEIAKDLDEHISTMRPNAIRAHLGMLRACIDDILDAHEGQGAIAMKTSRSPEPGGSLGSLIAQWRAEADKLQKVLEGDPNDEGASNAHGQLVMCIEELVDALKPLADLEAEMRRFAEEHPSGLGFRYVPPWIRKQALAWAERIEALQE